MKRILLLGLSLALLAPRVRADSSRVATAEALFNEGRRLKEAGDYAKACPMLAESQRLDPGTGTLLNLATCYEEAGKKASAWAAWIEAERSARAAGQTDREAHAHERAAELEKSMARMTIEVSARAPAGLQVTRGGEPISQATWGSALPVDSGSYEIVASAAGYESWRTTAIAVDGRTEVVSVPALTQSRATPSSAPVEAGSSGPTEPSDGSTQRVLGYVVGGVGVVGLGVSGVLGLLAIDKNNESKTLCSADDPNRCTQDGVNARNGAFGLGTASTVSFAVGAAALTTGLVLVFTAPSSTTHVVARPTWDGGTVTLGGTF